MPTDWSQWSREAVQQMEQRNRAWPRRYGLTNEPYRWNLDLGELVFARAGDEVVADLTLAGTVSSCERTFLWAWANDAIPPQAKRGLERVREFGRANNLPLLVKPEWAGGRPEGLEMLAIAARVLDAEGVLVDECSDVTMLFVLSSIRVREAHP